MLLKLIGVIFALKLSLCSIQAQQLLNFEQAFAALQKRNENLALSILTLEQLREKKLQAEKSIYPTLSGIFSFMKQESPPSSTANTIFPAAQNTGRINLNQSLFRGFKDMEQIHQLENQAEAQEMQFQQNLQVLYLELFDCYLKSLSLKKELLNLNVEKEINQRRVEALKKYLLIGKSRKSELNAVELNILNIDLQKEQLLAQINQLREIWHYLTGLEASLPFAELNLVERSFEPQDLYTNLDERPEIKQQIAQVRVAENALKIAKGNFWPNLDFNANYYFFRPGLQSQIHWDLGLQLNWTLFNADQTASQIKLAEIARAQASLSLSKIRQELKQQIDGSFQNFLALLGQINILKKALNLAQKNNQELRKDYEMGLINHLEFLQAITLEQQYQRNLDKLLYAREWEYQKLLVLTGMKKI